jgi:coenzyme F420-dependent glucose-6-phosphate dehydrogenase
VVIFADLDRRAAVLAAYAELGFSRLYLHQVCGEQERFIDQFGEQVLPQLS